MRTKIRLSPEELKLAMNADILLTKNRVMQKACEFFSQLSQEADHFFNMHVEHDPSSCYEWKAFVADQGPKIARGEQYKGLPYVMLDYPRKFSRDEVFAVRTMFWWGHYFIQTLHLKGGQQEKAIGWLPERLKELGQAGFFISEVGEEWIHDFEEKNYISLEGMHPEEFMNKLSADPFVRIAARIPLDDWDAAMEKMLCNYRLLIP